MRRLLLISVVLLIAFQGTAQEDAPDFTKLGDVVHSFFGALSENDEAARKAQFKTLFTEQGQVNAVIQKTYATANPALGSWEEFLTNSSDFYQRFELDYDEVEREFEYYVDLAAVHSLVYQVSSDRTTDKVYRQMLWVQFDLVFAQGRWYIDHVSWVNEVAGNSVREALYQDTLWHRPQKR